MEISTIENEDIKIVTLNGSLDTNTAPDAETCLMEMINSGQLKLIVDLENLEYISSAGLRVLLASTKTMKSNGGEFHICNPNEMVTEVFEMSGFNMIFKIFNSREDAISAYG